MTPIETYLAIQQGHALLDEGVFPRGEQSYRAPSKIHYNETHSLPYEQVLRKG